MIINIVHSYYKLLKLFYFTFKFVFGTIFANIVSLDLLIAMMEIWNENLSI